MKHVSRRPTQESLRIVLITSIVFPPMIVGSQRAFVIRTNNEMKTLPLTIRKKRARMLTQIDQVDGKSTRANHEMIRLKV